MKLSLESVGRYRLIFGYLIAGACLAFANQRLFLPGVAVALLGIAFRMWAAGYIQKNKQLAIDGPYALTRNPLYFGSFLLGVGGVMAVRAWLLLVIYIIGFAIFYLPTIRKEEKDLLAIFGDEFREYQKQVPAFFPWKPRLPIKGFSWSNMVRNGELKHAVFYLGFLSFLEVLGELRMLVNGR
ncbi:MAG: isoprenylcysteine carboxylmethyltransferase family protein [Armatimonadota bacterium]|nr:isoprenylcysteine carboxylmethyltransferase family protein [Armatimonadota bacterium]